MAQLTQTKPLLGRSKKYLEEALYRRLFREGSKKESIGRELNLFLKERKRVYKWEVGDTIKKLRDHKRFSYALKLSETMSKRGMNMTISDQAIHLDLVAKTRGISAAEEYFKKLPEPSKNHLCYGALLNCYCKELMVEKAESLVEKMKELKFISSHMSYNSLMTLYTKTGNPEKIPAIIQEMKSNDIMPDCFTYNVWMRGLAAVNDISGVERVIEEMKRDGRVAPDWTTYSNLASIYVKAGMFDKAETALKELEKKNNRRGLMAYQYLITLYGQTDNLIQVYRVWRSLKLAKLKMANISYLNMIQVLVNLKDLRGAETCYREWESVRSTYDIRISNVLIGAYTNSGMLEKAQALKERARMHGAKPNAKTWEIFADYYLKNGEMQQAVDCISKAISVGRGNGSKWFPSFETVKTLMTHFEKEKDVEGSEKFVEILKEGKEEIEAEIFESLIRTYAAASKTSHVMRRRLKMEKVEVSPEINELLDKICID